MGTILIVKAGTTLPGVASDYGDFEDWIAVRLGIPRTRIQVVEAFRGEALPDPEASVGVIVTGSAAMVSDRESWSEELADWLSCAVDARTPLLGICYGHQLLAHALGGQVGPNPRGREIGSVEVERVGGEDDPLFAALPRRMCVQTTHVESVLELPAGALRLARNGRDENHAFAVGERAWGVQWHPEFDAAVMRGYLEGRREILAAEGLDAVALLDRVAESPHGANLLERFAEIAT